MNVEHTANLGSLLPGTLVLFLTRMLFSRGSSLGLHSWTVKKDSLYKNNKNLSD